MARRSIAATAPDPATDRVRRRWIRAGRRFFSTDAATLARRLIGCRLVRVLEDGTRVSGVIVETEAYVGVEDLASHARLGRRTARNEPMYGRPGLAYVYFTYGMHHCMNVVCGREGEPAAVLVRALEPSEGVAEMRRRRGAVPRVTLCRGPGRLCRALGIDRSHSGLDLVSDPGLFVERPAGRGRGAGSADPAAALVNTARIGVGYADEWALAPLRWFAAGSDCVSRGRPGPAVGRRMARRTDRGTVRPRSMADRA